MKFQLLTDKTLNKKVDCLVLGVCEKTGLAADGMTLDASLGKLVSGLIKSGDIKGKTAETLMVPTPGNSQTERLLLVGLGEKAKLNAKAWRKAVRAAATSINKSGAKTATSTLAQLAIQGRDAAWAVTQLTMETANAQYRYDQTKSKKSDAWTLKTVNIAPAADASRKTLSDAMQAGEAISKGMSVTRELGNLPGNICTPSYLAQTATEMGIKYKSLKVKVLTEKQMEKLGMGSLLSVGNGSKEESRLIVIEHKGTSKAGSKPYCLVGKGITFDTGGISLKPGAGMDEMKFDMCGAASVIGTMTTVAELNLPINVVAVIAAAENMPSGKATKPGDIVTSMSGKTIEVLNTDAEGRLVLCDALTYAERFNPKTVIDVATLTGAAVATFGEVNTAMLSNNEALAKELFELGQQTLDTVWQLPLDEEYFPLLDSNFADLANIGGPKAGTITAACFLSRFAEKFQWAHLDIAGTAWLSGAQKGATGRPVPLLVEYLRRQKA
ncbi:leucyl aminopeptidase [Pseudohongiella spirulinae]|uniref:Probable cytosol aminopeptidase n=1 Tax=Pseudohongiella spirulinae TaxID=1249552 RepID=A0A0S2KBX3_9GAMM|nr:leucyl aminopeptidase [Pseudohongiella spirulinae]ALO45830.1 putative cytosol aminopeptidase [Pseudohongiella spirulinae]